MKLGPALARAPARPVIMMSEGGTMAQTHNKAGTMVGSHGLGAARGPGMTRARDIRHQT